MPKPSEWDVVATEEIGPWDVVETVPFGLVEPGQTAPLPESRETKQSPFSFSDIARKFGRGALDVMPEAGMLAGDAVGTFYGGKAMGPLGSAVGGFTMEGARQGIEQGILGTEEFPGFGENLGAMWDKGKEAFVGDVAGAGIFKGLGVVAKPAQLTKTGRMYLDSDEIKRATELIEKHNLPISPAALVANQKGGLPIKVAQALSDYTPAGMMWNAHKRAQLTDAVAYMSKGVTDDMPGAGMSQFDVGAQVFEDLARIRKTSFAEATAGYEPFKRALGTDPRPMESTRAALQNVRDTVQGKAAKEYADEWLGKIADGGMTPDQIYEFQKGIWKASRKAKSTEMGAALWNGLKADLSESEMLLLEAAKDKWKLVFEFKDNPTLKALMRKSNDPEKVVLNLFRSGNLEEVNTLRKAMDPEVFDIAKTRFVENLLEAGQKPGEFDGGQFLKMFKKYEKQLKNVLEEDEFANVSQFSEIVEASQWDMKMVKRGPADKFGLPLAGTGAIAYEITKNPAKGLAVMGSNWLFAKSLMNPTGVVRKFLTTGLEPSAILEPMAKVGAMNAVEGEPGPGFYHRMKAQSYRNADPDEISNRYRDYEKPPPEQGGLNLRNLFVREPTEYEKNPRKTNPFFPFMR